MRPRMYGSTLMKRVAHEQTDPRGARPARRSPISKSDGFGSPTGRCTSRTSRLLTRPNNRLRPMELEGRHVVVTGAGRGIGRALALRFADEGARAVVVSDMDEANARQVAKEVSGLADRGRRRPRAGHPRADRARRGRPTARSTCSSPTPASPGRAADRRSSTPTGTCCGASTRCRTCGPRARCCPGCSSAARATCAAPRRRPACSRSSARSATRSPSTPRWRSPSGCR